jgi:hypothetical protein
VVLCFVWMFVAKIVQPVVPKSVHKVSPLEVQFITLLSVILIMSVRICVMGGKWVPCILECLTIPVF